MCITNTIFSKVIRQNEFNKLLLTVSLYVPIPNNIFLRIAKKKILKFLSLMNESNTKYHTTNIFNFHHYTRRRFVI